MQFLEAKRVFHSVEAYIHTHYIYEYTLAIKLL